MIAAGSGVITVSQLALGLYVAFAATHRGRSLTE